MLLLSIHMYLVLTWDSLGAQSSHSFGRPCDHIIYSHAVATLTLTFSSLCQILALFLGGSKRG